MSELKPGTIIWIPCDVKPGPFSNERFVRVESEQGPWIGFVDVQFLKDPDEPNTCVKARVEAVEGEMFFATLPGHSLASRTFQGQRGQVTLAPLPA